MLIIVSYKINFVVLSYDVRISMLMDIFDIFFFGKHYVVFQIFWSNVVSLGVE